MQEYFFSNRMKQAHINIKRRKSKQIMIGNVPVGGDAPIAVQTMTNTETTDIDATVAQVQQMVTAGADIVRISTPNLASVKAFGEIKKQVAVPLIADIHFDYKIALAVADAGADCLRINPGNIGKLPRIQAVVDKAKDLNLPIRIGVNAGSLEKDLQKKYGEPTPAALVESAMRHVDILDKLNFDNFKLSLKASDVMMTLAAYRLIATKIEQPLHLGITEAGSLRTGTVKSAIGLGALLLDGIGDTLRISLAADPVNEVKVGWDILKSLKLRNKGVNLIACPSCSRQNFDVIKVVNELETRLEDVVEPIDVAVIGCFVNGPGESKEVEIGLTGASPMNLAFKDGKPDVKMQSADIVATLENMVREKIAKRESEKNNIIASSK